MQNNSLRRTSPLALGLAALAFCVLLGHAIARPGCESLFLTAYGSGMVPRVWLVESGVALLSVLVLEWLLQKMSPARLFVVSVLASAASMVVLLLLHAAHVKSAAFWLYVWKDTYVVVLVELFWIWANIVFDLKEAQSLYGFFCAAGSVGAVSGHALISFLAVRWGTYKVLWSVPVMLCVACGVMVFLMRTHNVAEKPRGFAQKNLGWAQRWRALGSSSYVLLLVGLVGVMQLVINLVDFQFNQVVEKVFALQDKRTQLLGVMYGVINGLGFVFQISTSWILKVCGVRGVMLGMPVVLSVCSMAFWCMPSFAVMSFGKILGKALDYSLFRASKEMLYIPLKYEEKTAGKTFVDIFAYRLSKGVASLGVMALGAAGASLGFTAVLVCLYGVWFVLVIAIVRRFYYLKGHV